MTARSDWLNIATLIVAVLTLVAVGVLLLRPAAPSPPNSQANFTRLETELQGLREDIAELRATVEASEPSGPSVDLSSVESRLDRLETSMTTVSTAIDAMNSTARAICQMVADSPFISGGEC